MTIFVPGQELSTDSDCLATLFYDGVLLRLPSEVQTLLDVELELSLDDPSEDNTGWTSRVLFEPTSVVLGAQNVSPRVGSQTAVLGSWRRIHGWESLAQSLRGDGAQCHQT